MCARANPVSTHQNVATPPPSSHDRVWNTSRPTSCQPPPSPARVTTVTTVTHLEGELRQGLDVPLKLGGRGALRGGRGRILLVALAPAAAADRPSIGLRGHACSESGWGVGASDGALGVGVGARGMALGLGRLGFGGGGPWRANWGLDGDNNRLCM